MTDTATTDANQQRQQSLSHSHRIVSAGNLSNSSIESNNKNTEGAVSSEKMEAASAAAAVARFLMENRGETNNNSDSKQSSPTQQ